MAVRKKNKALVKIGDNILFSRRNIIIQGTVIKILENTVMVEIPFIAQQELNIASNLTIVNHKTYDISPDSCE